MTSFGDDVSIELIAEMADEFTKSLEEMTSHIDSFSPSSSLLNDIKQHMFNTQNSLNEKLANLEFKSKAFDEKKAKLHALVEEQTAAVTAKEQSLCDCLQELKDAAISAITAVREKSNAAYPIPATDDDFFADKSVHATIGEVEPCSCLQQLCEQMDVNGILKLIAEYRKNTILLRGELPFALRSSPDPALLVLNALEGFYPQNKSNSNQASDESRSCQLIRKACRLLMESFVLMLRMAEPEVDRILSFEIKKKAKVIAIEWSRHLDNMALDPSYDYSSEAQFFLQLLATFRISSDFNEDELVKLAVVITPRRRQAFEICHAAGLATKATDIMEVLISKRRFLDAAHFAQFFEVTEAFPLVPLLKRYLEDAGEIISRSKAAGLEKEATYQEFSALKNVTRCIKEYNLQADYPPGDLQKRLDHIKVVMARNKRAANGAKCPPMKRRANDDYVAHNHLFSEDNIPNTPYHESSRYFIGRDGHSYNPPGYATHGHPDKGIPTFSVSPNYGSFGGFSSIRSVPFDHGSYGSSSGYRGYMGSNLYSSQQS